MANPRKPRAGSMQFWPRKRAARGYARVRNWPTDKNTKLLGFAGDKVGMTHIIATDNRKNSLTKGEDVNFPVTIIECPPIKICSIRFYKTNFNGAYVIGEVFSDKLDKEMDRKVCIPKKVKKTFEDYKEFDDIKVMVYTQPKMAHIGRKRPEVFEVGLGGSKEDKLKFAKENLGKEFDVSDVISEGDQVDIHAVTKGKGFQGPVKRFGVKLRSHKAEKTKRGPGSLGGWKSQGHVMYRVAHAGKMGFHTRTEFNKWIMKVGSKPEEINPIGGFIGYGFVNNKYLLVKGSVGGVEKRIIRFNKSIRPNHTIPNQVPEIQYTSLTSRQGK